MQVSQSRAGWQTRRAAEIVWVEEGTLGSGSASLFDGLGTLGSRPLARSLISEVRGTSPLENLCNSSSSPS